ncbi:HEPN domain-containing protein [Streptomyces sp. NPDC029674]|uniref:HEPN domain-containing protein n=1 Tax=Streptomyces sp. NPDC029674 TaxID=3365297 RepID=UPI00384ECED8
MPTQKFSTQLDDVEDLLNLAEAITLRHPAFSYLPSRPTPSPILAGAVVLLCARFEEFIKDVVAYALERHGDATPRLMLWDLPEQLQVLLISKNMNAALQAKRFGKTRDSADRISEGVSAAKGIVAGAINADHAIETGGNPGPDTVSELMKLVGVEKPWPQISKYFEVHYMAPSNPGLSGMALGNLQERLRELVNLRNVVAHSGARIPASPAEIRFNVHFARYLADAIYQVLKDFVETYAQSVGRVPGLWTP